MSAENSGLSPEKLMAAIADAESRGFEVVRSDADHLLLDLDTPASVEQFHRVFPVVREKFRVIHAETWLSKSGRFHARLKLAEPLDIGARLTLQAALGSDGVKEVLTLVRVHNGCAEPSILFKPKQ